MPRTCQWISQKLWHVWPRYSQNIFMITFHRLWIGLLHTSLTGLHSALVCKFALKRLHGGAPAWGASPWPGQSHLKICALGLLTFSKHLCWNVMLCGTMSCLQDQTLWCEAILRAKHSDWLGSSWSYHYIIVGSVMSLCKGSYYWFEHTTNSLYGQWIMAWSLVCNNSPPPNQQSVSRRVCNTSFFWKRCLNGTIKHRFVFKTPFFYRCAKKDRCFKRAFANHPRGVVKI